MLRPTAEVAGRRAVEPGRRLARSAAGRSLLGFVIAWLRSDGEHAWPQFGQVLPASAGTTRQPAGRSASALACQDSSRSRSRVSPAAQVQVRSSSATEVPGRRGRLTSSEIGACGAAPRSAKAEASRPSPLARWPAAAHRCAAPALSRPACPEPRLCRRGRPARCRSPPWPVGPRRMRWQAMLAAIEIAHSSAGESC